MLIVVMSTCICTVFIFHPDRLYIFPFSLLPFKKTMMTAMLILQIFPSFVGMVAIYVLLLRIGGLDTLWGLVLVYLAGNIPYNTWLVKAIWIQFLEV